MAQSCSASRYGHAVHWRRAHQSKGKSIAMAWQPWSTVRTWALKNDLVSDSKHANIWTPVHGHQAFQKGFSVKWTRNVKTFTDTALMIIAFHHRLQKYQKPGLLAFLLMRSETFSHCLIRLWRSSTKWPVIKENYHVLKISSVRAENSHM